MHYIFAMELFPNVCKHLTQMNKGGYEYEISVNVEVGNPFGQHALNFNSVLIRIQIDRQGFKYCTYMLPSYTINSKIQLHLQVNNW